MLMLHQNDRMKALSSLFSLHTNMALQPNKKQRASTPFSSQTKNRATWFYLPNINKMTQFSQTSIEPLHFTRLLNQTHTKYPRLRLVATLTSTPPLELFMFSVTPQVRANILYMLHFKRSRSTQERARLRGHCASPLPSLLRAQQCLLVGKNDNR